MKNVTLDFTTAPAINAEQELAIMPAVLAKRLLRLLALDLKNSSLADIIEQHVKELRECEAMNEVLSVSDNFIHERALIQNVVMENWEAYTVTVAPPENEAIAYAHVS